MALGPWGTGFLYPAERLKSELEPFASWGLFKKWDWVSSFCIPFFEAISGGEAVVALATGRGTWSSQ